jgi:hypothetical protein
MEVFEFYVEKDGYFILVDIVLPCLKQIFNFVENAICNELKS